MHEKIYLINYLVKSRWILNGLQSATLPLGVTKSPTLNFALKIITKIYAQQ